jgi:hypothetical protein
MNNETSSLLKQFIDPNTGMAACFDVYGQNKHFAVPAMLKKAYDDGFIEPCHGEDQVKHSDSVYAIKFILTDAGRNAIGVENSTTPKAATVKQKGLF